jgi:hypothetical protein
MRRSAIVALLAGLAFAAASTPAGAELPALPSQARGELLAQVGGEVGGAVPDFHSQFKIDGSQDYEVRVLTFGSAVVLDVVRGEKSETAYIARGVATRNRVQATFGGFGRVSMRFRESRHKTSAGRRHVCKGSRRFVVRRGVFVGNLRFSGENQYVSAHAHRARGTVRTIAPRCRGGSARHGQRSAKSTDGSSFLPPQLNALGASWREDVNSIAFLTFTFRGRSLSLATSEESMGKLAILRIAMAKGGSPFRVDDALTSATASPPAPFHGTGRYRAAPDGSRTWTGNLSVDFPGAPRFPLTGPQFKATIDIPF